MSTAAPDGTPAYMSPEQARGLTVDKRTDIWSFGCVLYEMLTGRVAFPGDTVSDSIAKVLEREPDWSALPAATPAPIRRLLLRCLMKDPKRRLRDIGDARVEIDAMDEAPPGAGATAVAPPRAMSAAAWLPWIALVLVAAAVGTREALRPAPAPAPAVENPFANATFSSVTNWEGSEEQPEISPDGRYVAFVSDHDGQFDVWVSQLGTGEFNNLTPDMAPMTTPGNILRSLGFNGEGSEIWFNPLGNPGRDKMLMPLTPGGAARPFLPTGKSTPSWSPNNTRLAFIDSNAMGDPLYIADRLGANALPINVLSRGKEPFWGEGVHTHNPVWSLDGEWLYFVHGTGPAGRMDVWRMKPSGESPEQLPSSTRRNFLAARFAYAAL